MRFPVPFIQRSQKTTLRHILEMTLIVTVIIIIATFPLATAADLKLIDAATLKDSQAKWVILDARPKADWEAGHIPGAITSNWENYTRTSAQGVKFSSLPPQELAVLLAGTGN